LKLPEGSDKRLMTRYYTFSDSDLAVINQHRHPENRLGFALQLCYLRYPGRKWGLGSRFRLISLPVAQQLGVDPAAVGSYAQACPATWRQHLKGIRREFGFQPFTADLLPELSDWLLPQALATDQGLALLTALIEELRRRHIILPALSTLERLGWEVRQKARQITFTHLTTGLTPAQETQLD
jgi:hypothetical protein